MELKNQTDILIFLNKRNICVNANHDDNVIYCKLDNYACDHNSCPILKECMIIEDFINTLDNGYNELKCR